MIKKKQAYTKLEFEYKPDDEESESLTVVFEVKDGEEYVQIAQSSDDIQFCPKLPFGMLSEIVTNIENWRNSSSATPRGPVVKDYREEYNFYGNFDRVTLQFPSPYFLHFPSPVIIQGCQEELAWEKKVIVSYEEAFRNELRAFYDNVQNNKEPKTTVHDALKHTRFVYQVIAAL